MSKALIDMSHMDMCNMKSLVNVRLASNADTKMNDISHRLKYCHPMVKCEEDSGAEDVVCGEPVMSPEVEDLLVSSSVGDGFYAAPLDFSALCGY